MNTRDRLADRIAMWDSKRAKRIADWLLPVVEQIAAERAAEGEQWHREAERRLDALIKVRAERDELRAVIDRVRRTCVPDGWHGVVASSLIREALGGSRAAGLTDKDGQW